MRVEAYDPNLDAREDTLLSSRAAASFLLGTVLLLICIGILTLFSIGIGQNRPLHYPTRQLVFVLAGVIAAVITAKLPLGFWRVLFPWIYLGTAVLLILARLIGPRINGAHRWLIFGPVSFQPSEMAKLTAVIWIALWMSHHRRYAQDFLRGFFIPLLGLGLLCLLVLFGPDFGTTMLIGGAGVILMYMGGTRLFYCLLPIIGGGLMLGMLILHDPVRLNRITSFLHPEKYADNESFQLMNSLHAFMEGGGTGVGIGQSLQKFSYLPEAHTDFIMAIIAEEGGLLGSLLVLTLFFIFFVCGMWIGWRCADGFGRLLAFGVTIMISLQALINIAVVTGSAPTKGLPLPFISHGGSNLVFMLAMVGLLIRIATGGGDPRPEQPARDRRHWL